MRNQIKFATLAFGTAVLAGCGGGGSSATTDPGGSVPTGPTNNFGPIETRGQVNGTPLVRDLGKVSTVALAGILTDATYRPQGQPDNETAIAVGNAGSIDMFLESGEKLDTWIPNLGDANYTAYPIWSPDGSRLYFASLTGIYYVTPTDPTTPVSVIALSSGLNYFTLSPSGNRICYTRTPPGDADSEVYVRDVAGGATKRLTNNDDSDFGGVWTDEDHVIIRTTVGADTATNVVKVSDLTSVSYSTTLTAIPVARSNDGTLFLNAGPVDSAFAFSTTQRAGTFYQTKDYLDAKYGNLAGASPSPDGARWVVSSTPGGVYTTELAPVTVNPIIGARPVPAGVSWQPPIGVTKFVGAAGKLGSTSAGIIATNRTGENRNGLSSFVSWDATTRSTSTVSDDTSEVGSGAKTYTIEADKITSLKYSNRPFFLPQSIVSVSGTQNGAFVTVSGVTGTVKSIVVYTETRGGKPTIRKQGDGKVIEGAILSVWNEKGKNIASGGALRVTLNASGEPQL